jgi:uncharacterized membrane protein
MSADYYYVIHFFALVLLVSGVTQSLLGSERNKMGAVLTGVSTLLVAVAGFGLIAKLGYSISSFWILSKLLIWFLIGFGAPMVAKRLPHLKRSAYFVFLALIGIAVVLAVFKPH